MLPLLASFYCKVIQISPSWKFLLLEWGILGFGIWHSAQGMKNPLDNPSSNSGIQYLLRIQYQTPRHGNTESQIVLELHLPSLNKPFFNWAGGWVQMCIKSIELRNYKNSNVSAFFKFECFAWSVPWKRSVGLWPTPKHGMQRHSLLKFKRALYGWSDMHHSTPPILFNMDKL